MANQKEVLLQSSFLRLNQVLQLIPVCKSTWWAGVKSGRYPQSVKISTRCTAWRTSDIKRLIEDFGLSSMSEVSNND